MASSESNSEGLVPELAEEFLHRYRNLFRISTFEFRISKDAP
jgi:hypothetical protein